MFTESVRISCSQPGGQLTFSVVVDDQQPGPLRPLTFTMTLMKHFNLLSVASAKSTQHIRTL